MRWAAGCESDFSLAHKNRIRSVRRWSLRKRVRFVFWYSFLVFEADLPLVRCDHCVQIEQRGLAGEGLEIVQHQHLVIIK